MKEEKKFILYNDYVIPPIGFGTGTVRGILNSPLKFIKAFITNTKRNLFLPNLRKEKRYSLKKDLHKERSLKRIISLALDNGCKLFDTARVYQFSENYVGETIFKKNASYKREDIFIITKVTNKAQRNKTIWEELQVSLDNLGVEYIDIYLLHWPQTDTYIESWKVMEDIYNSGKAKAIGVCNCHIHHLEMLKKNSNIIPMVNEIECHPLFQQREIREYCEKNKIQVIAYTPTGKMCEKIFSSKLLQKIANAHGVEISQVILRWHYQCGVISVANTTSEKHIIQNLNIWNFELTEQEMEDIKTMECGFRIGFNPDDCDFSKL